jgi:8-oxo-dGTP pyrophosphatase MutT (NUDIX family)
MYKIFVGNKPIVLTTELETETDFKNFMIDSVDINKVRLVGVDKDVLLKKFLALLPNVIAGGGKVYNANNEILFIFRNGKWDLPKGKAEAKETINQTALREVEEETGITGLSITKPLEITYHIFKRNDRHYIKVTYWFQMYSEYEGELIPQEKEGITKVKWIAETKLKKVLNNSYSNIKLLI